MKVREVFRTHKLLFVTSVAVLFLSFSFNVLGAVTTDAFLQNFKDSEALVSKEIICRGDYFGGQLIAGLGTETAVVPSVCYPHQLMAYSSQFGLQGRIYTLGYKLFALAIHNHARAYIALAQLLTALLSAVCLSAFVVWVRQQFGKYAAITALGGIAVSPMLVMFGRNLYWSLPLMILPFVYVLYTYKLESSKKRKAIVLLGLGLLLYARFLCGYEYVTTISIMCLAAASYYLYIARAKLSVYAKELAIIFAVSLLSFSAALATHIYTLSIYTGSTSRAISVVRERAFARVADSADYLSYPFSNYAFTLSDDYKITNAYLGISAKADAHSQLWASIVSFLNYALLPVTTIPIAFNSPFGSIIQSFTVFTAVLVGLFISRKQWATRRDMVQIEATFLATGVGFVGHISWQVLARPHSLVHAHINGILMYLPFALLGFILIGKCLEAYVSQVTVKLHVSR